MTVVSERPKRRAASSNISYKETTDLEPLEQYSTGKSSKRQRKSGSNGSGSKYQESKDNGKLISKSQLQLLSRDRDSGSSDDNLIPWNWQPPFKEQDYFNNQLDLKNAKVDNNVLKTKDGFKLSKNDCIYMISEPPGEPYYIGRILGFTKKDKNLTTRNASNYLFKVNWFYRPRDLNQKSSDSRLLYATMHSDECPMMSFRGLITLKHRSEISDLDEYRRQPNCFYFDKLFDRYMLKYYDILPTANLVNLPPNYYKALNKRFPYVFVEIGRGKDLLSAPKSCEKCFQWCSSMDSVMCINCELFYHMMCLDPPLMRKPQRGFGWSCALCNKKLESKMSKNRGEMLTTSSLTKLNSSRNSSEELVDSDPTSDSTDELTVELPKSDVIPKYEELAIQFLAKDKNLSLSQRRILEEWPYRYLGMHVKLEDAMDLQDRPYARSASRLGSKHQLTGLRDWTGHHLQYYDPDESMISSQPQSQKKKKGGNTKKKNSPTPNAMPEDEENLKLLPIPEEFRGKDPSDFPLWLQERPKGYIERGNDDTVTLMWKMPSEIVPDVTLVQLNEYMKRCSGIAKNLGLLPSTPNFIDSILKNYLDSNYDLDQAYDKSVKLTRDSLKEPTLTKEEVERFEEGVRKYGSELYPVYKEVETKSSADIVRFYYLWKKTPSGHKIWDNYEGRAKNKLKNANKLSSGAVDDVANSGDDSAYDSSKLIKSKRHNECKHCHTTQSLQWFRVTGHNKAPTDPEETIIGLCLRCAKLWRRYAVKWDEPSEVFRKNQQRSGNGWKRKIEFELLTDAEKIVEARNKQSNKKPKSNSPTKKEDNKLELESLKIIDKKTLEVKLNLKKSSSSKSEKLKKKSKAVATTPVQESPAPPPKKVFKLELPLPPIPLFQTNPNYIYPDTIGSLLQPPQPFAFEAGLRSCCVCRTIDNVQDVVICNNCGLNVHRSCYGAGTKKSAMKNAWNCDRCLNDMNPVLSTNYSCKLCTTKNSHYDEMIHGDPNQFPDLLKPTAEDQWCHLICSIFDDNCKIGSLNTYYPILNTELTLQQNSHRQCQICHTQNGSIKKCEFCDDEFHVTCAQNIGSFFIGFLLEPCDLKDKKCIKIQEYIYGDPKPVLVCNKHLSQPLPPLFFPLRIPGKRVNAMSRSGTVEQPLITLYIQDHMKNDDTSAVTVTIPKPNAIPQSCDICHTSESIIFLQDSNQLLCHSCYAQRTNSNYEVERQNYSTYAQDAMRLLNLVNSPLPTEPKPQHQHFNKIRINDILS